MRIIAYGVRKDELAYFDAASQELNVDIKLIEEPLSMETIHLAEGYDGITDVIARAYDREVFQEMRSLGIRFYSTRSAGVDGLDLDMAKSHELQLARVPEYSPHAIAEYSVAHALVLLRHMQTSIRRMGMDDYRSEGLMGGEIREQTVGIIGTGRIGRLTAQIYKGFGARVIGYDVYQNDEARGLLEYKNTLEELLAESTLLSLHVPLTPDNKYMLNRETIALLPDGAVIINTARGGHIDTEALYDALVSGKVAAAGLDVYEYEEGIFGKDHSNDGVSDELFRKLTALPNVLVTPHIAYDTTTAVYNKVTIAVKNLCDFITHGTSENEI